MRDLVTKAKAASAAIAQARNGLSTFSLMEFGRLLLKFKCPYARSMPNQLWKAGIIVKHGNNYVFASAEPVHFSKLMDGLENCASTQERYSKKCRETKHHSSVDSSVVRPEMTIELMIETLKAAGYKILQPYTAYKPI